MKRTFLFLLLAISPMYCFSGNITISVPDAIEGRVLDAMAYKNGYTDTIVVNDATVPNPQTKVQFVRQFLKKYFEEVTRQYEAEKAAETEFRRVRNLSSGEIVIP